MKVDMHRQQRVVRYGVCHEQYSEYVVRIEEGQPVAYGLRGNTETKIDCAQVTSELLNIPPEMEYLKFPLAVGNNWVTRRFFKPAAARTGRWFTYNSKVLSFEKVKSEKAEVQVFKIERLEQNVTEAYFYSPQAKAIVLDRKVADPLGGTASRKVTLIDSSVR